MPSLIAFVRSKQGRGLRLVLVDVGEDRETVERTIRERGYHVPVLLDERGEALRAFGVRATPTVRLLGRNGSLLGGAIGPRGWTRSGGRRLLEALLSCPAPG